MTYKYGIDFGTTNSSIALRFVGDDKEEHTLVVDVKDTLPHETLPSVVLVDRTGSISVGEDAINKYTQSGIRNNDQLFIKRIKLDLENKGADLCYQVAGRTYSGVDLIAAILKALRLKAEAVADELDIDVSGVVMGVPVEYGDIQKNLLKQALVKAGFYANEREADQKTEFVSEPVAVAVHYGLNLKHDTTVLVFDFGGGTLDLAIVNLKKQISTDKLHPHQTIAKERITLGGEELTRLFFINSFCSPKKYGAKRIGQEFGFGGALKPEQLWDKLSACEDGVRFIAAVERCKCDLSRTQKYRFSFIGRNIQLDEMTFYRDDFANAIDVKLEEIDALIDRCLANGNIADPYEIDHVILAGGSSLIPAVQNLLVDRFGSMRVTTKLDKQDSVVKAFKHNRASDSEVLTSIVRGLAMVGCKNETLVDDVVDSDYGIWDGVENCFIPIIRKGIPVKSTVLNKMTQQGIMEEFECLDQSVSSVEALVYQKSITGEHMLGRINIPNPGGKKYRIFMQVDKKKGMLTVSFYDVRQHRWIDEIPLNQRQYTLK